MDGWMKAMGLVGLRGIELQDRGTVWTNSFNTGAEELTPIDLKMNRNKSWSCLNGIKRIQVKTEENIGK